MLHDRNKFVLVEILGITLFNRMKELWFKGIDDLKPVLFLDTYLIKKNFILFAKKNTHI